MVSIFFLCIYGRLWTPFGLFVGLLFIFRILLVKILALPSSYRCILKWDRGMLWSYWETYQIIFSWFYLREVHSIKLWPSSNPQKRKEKCAYAGGSGALFMYAHSFQWNRSHVFFIIKSCRLYYTKLTIGTPSKDYHVQVDTGSDILWVNCAGCMRCPSKSSLGVWLIF